MCIILKIFADYPIECFFFFLPNDTKYIDIASLKLTYIPNMFMKFKKLESLNCSNNELSSFPELPNTLEELLCDENKFTCLPKLPESLTTLNCSNNMLTKLPFLPSKLHTLDCTKNKLSSLFELPNTLRCIAFDFQLYAEYAVKLPDEIDFVNYFKYSNQDFYSNIQKHNHNIIKKFRFTFYCMKFKKQFMNLLWKIIREPKIKDKFHPSKLQEFIGNNDDDIDLETVIDEWAKKNE
jgi:hypothetical protein